MTPPAAAERLDDDDDEIIELTPEDIAEIEAAEAEIAAGHFVDGWTFLEALLAR